MVSNTQHLIFIYLSVCVLMSVGFKVKYLEYCGPSDKTLRIKSIPWPELKPGQPVNITMSFTPDSLQCIDLNVQCRRRPFGAPDGIQYLTFSVDIFSSTVQIVISRKDGNIILKEAEDIPCNKSPQLCSLAAGETQTLSYYTHRFPPIFPLGFKGTFNMKLKLYNQDQVMWFCVEVEIAV